MAMLPLSTTMRSAPPSPQEHKSAHHKRAQHTNTMSKSEAPWQARVKATPRCKQMTMANSQVKGGPGSLKGDRFQVPGSKLQVAHRLRNVGANGGSPSRRCYQGFSLRRVGPHCSRSAVLACHCDSLSKSRAKASCTRRSSNVAVCVWLSMNASPQTLRSVQANCFVRVLTL